MLSYRRIQVSNHDDQDLVAKAKRLDEKKSKLIEGLQDPVIKALISLNPVASPFMSVLSDRLQKQQEIRLQEFLITVAQEIEENKDEIKTKVDTNFLKQGEFAAIVESVLIEVSRTADREKLRLLREFLKSSILSARPDVTWQELFLKYLSQLAGIHLVVLELFYRNQKSLARTDRLGQAIIPGRVPLGINLFKSQLPTADDHLLRITCIDLANLGLLVDWRHLSGTREGFQEQYCLTDNGLLFMRYMKGEWNQSPESPIVT